MSIKKRSRLGQHFIKETALKKVFSKIENIKKKDTTIVEIGAGKGAFTKELLKFKMPLFAIEKDERLIEILKEKFDDKNFNLHKGDIRDFDFIKKIKTKKYIVVANIPYYITGKIIKQFLTAKNQPLFMYLILQKEVAERIVAKNNKESLLSLSVKFFGTPKYLLKLNKRDFSPAPKVNSALISIQLKKKPSLKKEADFFKIINISFRQKRKCVLKKFKNDLKVYKKMLSLGINEKTRAEDISFEMWEKIIS